ncbi:MAG: NTP transferase domain-containing protein [Acidobacteriota bacterium]|nr:NTP transferase domain-containing protein [Acidobacteriota bacterium]
MSGGLTLAILAAGRSARFGRPKTLEPVGPSGEVLFEYAICDAVRAGCEKVVFVTSADWDDELMSRAAERAGGAVPVDSVIQSLGDLPAGAGPPAQRAKPWGTGHAVLALRKKVEEPFLVVNADDFYGPRAIESFGRRSAAGLVEGDDSHFLGAYELHRTGVSRTSGVNRGILTAGPDSTLKGIDEIYDVRETDSGLVGRDGDGEARSLAPGCPCSMNLWGFRPSIFGLLEAAFTDFYAGLDDSLQDEFLLSETVGQLIGAGSARVRLVPMTQSTAGLTYPGDLPPVASTLQQCVEAGDYPADLGEWFGERSSRRPA